MTYSELFKMLDKAHPGKEYTPEIGKDYSDLTSDDLHELRSLSAQYNISEISFNGSRRSCDQL